MIVTTRDLFTIPGYSVRPGFCRAGSRNFFEKHGLDWRDFVRNGIDADKLRALHDGLTDALVAWAEQRQASLQSTAEKSTLAASTAPARSDGKP